MPRFDDYMPAGVIPATLLAFDDDFAIDEAATRDHLRDVAGVAGISAIAVNAHASEVHACTVDEQRRVLDLTMEEVGDTLPVINGGYADGSHEAEAFLDSDGVDRDRPVRLHVRVTVKDGAIAFDFTGSADQCRGPVNLRPSLIEGCCFHTLIDMLDPAMRYSDAVREEVKITTRPRSVVNAEAPAPVSSYMQSCAKLVDVLLEALGPFNPARATASTGGSGGALTVAWSRPERLARGNQYEIFGSAFGGSNGQDGASGTTVHLSNIYITPIEIIETEFPCRIRRFELIPGSGGAGEFRGGLSLRREYELLEPATVIYRGDRAKFAPRGVAGGLPGKSSRFLVNPGTADEKHMPAQCRVELEAGESFRIEAAGGGGYGDPARRDPIALERDAREGYADSA